MKQITSIEELKKAAINKEGNLTEFFILLAGGLCRSSKRIIYFSSDNTFTIINEIDDSELEEISEEELRKKTLIIEAIEKGAFFQY